ncbi:MAG: GNAT family N-acetyltransferase [Proteobacteria bacterium]|nr:GNAT family N-acetyltransferase [Pseudomonadota bacterium]
MTPAPHEGRSAGEPKPDTSSPSTARRRPWIPIRSLAPRHRERILAHLLALEEHDRFLRFGYPASDAHIARYVDTLDFDHDEVFGLFSRRLELIALGHLAHAPRSGAPQMSEFGVSVLRRARGRGFGHRLFEHAMLHARNRGVQTLFIHALSENGAMLKIARDAGATLERDGPECDAWLRLPPDTLGSHVDELIGEQAAEIDYGLRRTVHQAGELIGALTEATAAIVRGKGGSDAP